MAGWGSVFSSGRSGVSGQTGQGSVASVSAAPDIWKRKQARWTGSKPVAQPSMGDALGYVAKPGNTGTQPGAAAPQVASPVASTAPVATTPETSTTSAAASTVPAMPTMQEGRMNALSTLMTNPESLSAQTQAEMLQKIRDSRDASLVDQQRQIREGFGGRGVGDSGMSDSMLFQSQLARDADLAGAQRDLGIAAATTNFKDRQDVASLLFGQQTGQQQAMQSLADQIFNTGVNSQTQQGNLLSQLGSLVGAGTSYNQNQLQTIWNQLLTRYQNPDVSNSSMVPSTSNDWLAAMSGGNGGGNSGGSNWLDSLTSGVGAASSIAALFA